VELTDAHAALADAEATAALLVQYKRRSTAWTGWDRLQEFSEVFDWPAPPRRGTVPVWRGFARELTAPGSELMDRVAGQFARFEGLEGADEYLDLLDRVLLVCKLPARKIAGPRRLSAQRRALDGMASSLGLSRADAARLNRHCMLRL